MSKKHRKTNKEKKEINRNKIFAQKIKRYEYALKGKLGGKAPAVFKKLKDETFAVLKRVHYSTHGASSNRNRFLEGTPFPKNYEEISSNVGMPSTGMIESELNWTSFILTEFSSEINNFLKFKEKFDSTIIGGDYSKANAILESVECELGCSLWLIEARLLLAEYQCGLTENRTFLEGITSRCEQNNNLCLLANYLSFRAEKDVSYANYRRAVSELLKAHDSKVELHNVLQYINFKLDTINFSKSSSFDSIIYFESVFPVIDRYLTCIRTLQALTSNYRHSYDKVLLKTIKCLKESISDFSLDCLLYYMDPSQDIPKSTFQPLLLKGYDAYTIGNYEDSLQIAEDTILEGQQCFKAYELYAKSLLHLERDCEIPFDEGTLLAQILNHTYNILAKNNEAVDSCERLLKIGCSLASNTVSNQMIAFVTKHRYLGNNTNNTVLGELGATAITPRFAMTMENLQESYDCLNKQNECFPGSVTIDFFLKLIEREDSFEYTIPNTRRKKYNSRFLMQEGKYPEAIRELLELKELNENRLPYLSDIVSALFECYMKTHRFTECLHLIVDTFLSNRYLLMPFDLLDFYNKWFCKGFQETPNDICWPILESILQQLSILPKNNWKLYTAIDDFMYTVQIERPSELSDFQEEKLIYLLRYICIPDVLEDTIGVYESTEDIENERINVCQMLIKLDTENEGHYSDEIKRLMREQEIRKAIQHIDQRRIHIETEGILHSLDSLYQERFRRCLELSRLDELLRKSPSSNILSRLKDQERLKVVFTDVAFREFEDLFNELKNRFISSNEYGLDSYLSVRIRHGTLAGQIRSHLETENLITRKNTTDNIYASNHHWIETVFKNYNEDIQLAADGYLKEFSREVDETIKHINDNLIQIKGADKPEGLFDYGYNEKELLNIWAGIFARSIPVDYDQFIDVVINELWARTEAILKRVRLFIRKDFRDNLTDILNGLLKNINKLHVGFNSSVFSNSVTRCRTNIQNELESIAEWFKVTEEKVFPDFGLEQLVHTTLGMVRKCYPSNDFQPNISVKSQIVIAGKRFESFVDIMFIVLENIAKHSKADSNGCLNAGINIHHDNSMLVILLSNPISDDCDIVEVKNRIAGLKRPEEDAGLMKLTRREGGSGYYKLHKILQHDLVCKEYDVKFIAEEDSQEFKTIIKMSLKGMVV